MKTIATIALCIALVITFTLPVAACGQSQTGSAASTQSSTKRDDELHFVSVLTLRGELTNIDRANCLVSIKDQAGHSTTLEVRSEKDLNSLKAGDRVVVHYVEGARVEKKKSPGKAASVSLNDGISIAEESGSAKKTHALVASVGTVDAADQEVALREPDGSIETIMVVNPEDLGQIKAGDEVIIRRAEALVLSIEREG